MIRCVKKLIKLAKRIVLKSLDEQNGTYFLQF
jgi:hypothetical protein